MRVLKINDWVEQNTQPPQFIFIDENFEVAERLKDGSIFIIGDWVEYKNSTSNDLIESRIVHFETERKISVILYNGDVIKIDNIIFVRDTHPQSSISST
jgi:hypothetical protein